VQLLPLFFLINSVFNLVIPVNFMEKGCGLDVHKDSVFACIPDSNGEKILEQRSGTLTGELMKLRDIMVTCGCDQATMESTRICWIPVWCVLKSDFSLKRLLHNSAWPQTDLHIPLKISNFSP
jgi:hypothetical protein